MFEAFADLPAVIFDMRGYPNYTMPTLAAHLAGRPVSVAQFRRPAQLATDHEHAVYFEQEFGVRREDTQDPKTVRTTCGPVGDAWQ